MEVEVTAVVAATVVAALGLAFTGYSVRENSIELKRGRYLRTLDFVSGEFNSVAQSRAVLRDIALTANNDVRAYVASHPDKAQDLLAFVYVLNRIGAGVRNDALSADVIFDVWSPEWFIGHYERLQPFLADDLERRGPDAAAAYAFFAWLSTEKCPPLVGKYPRTDVRVRRP